MQERLETKMVPKGQRRHDVPLYGRLLGGKGGRGNGLVVTIYLAMVCLTTQSRNHPLYASSSVYMESNLGNSMLDLV
jgi:hypothetical protein